MFKAAILPLEDLAAYGRYLLLPAIMVLALLPGGAEGVPLDIERASVSSDEIEGNFQSLNADISHDGRWVAFDSNATNLDPDDTSSIADIFVRDLSTQTTHLISSGPGIPGPSSNGHSLWPSISADGTDIAFESLATNLHTDDTDATSDVYVHDQCCGGNGFTSLVSRASGFSGAKGNGASTQADISGNGLIVAFQSVASNLDPADTDASEDIFIRDTFSSVTELVSRATGAAGAASNGTSFDASLDADGGMVAFESTATNLHPSDTDSTLDVYVRDRSTDTTILVSRADGVNGVKANGASSNAFLSADGRYVAFQSNANNLHPDDPDTSADIYVRDLVLNTTTLISRASDGSPTNGVSVDAVISYDGRYVVFDSNATNIVPNDTNAISDIFVADTLLGYTVRVSLDYNGHEVLGGNPTRPSIANAARGVVFHSTGNYLPNDSNFVSDVMVVQPDPDDDLVLSPLDNCGLISNAGQLDTDGDGLGDVCDEDDDGDSLNDVTDGCPTAGEDLDQFSDSDGCPDPDNDLDGVCDPGQAAVGCTGSDTGKTCFDPAGTLSCPTIDCRNLAEDMDAFKDSDGCPDPDNDNDSFPDVTDDCPGTDSVAGPDGMLGSAQDLNHNGIQDGAEAAHTTDDSALTFEDFDGVIDFDGCHDSPGDDYDGDGLTDEFEVFTLATLPYDPDTDADSHLDGADNCPRWANAAQNLPAWPIPANDADCDGFSSQGEATIGTDPTRQCPAGGTPDAWPVDFNKSGNVNIADVTALKPVFLQSVPPGPARYDLNASGAINIADVTLLKPFFLQSCTP